MKFTLIWTVLIYHLSYVWTANSKALEDDPKYDRTLTQLTNNLSIATDHKTPPRNDISRTDQRFGYNTRSKRRTLNGKFKQASTCQCSRKYINTLCERTISKRGRKKQREKDGTVKCSVLCVAFLGRCDSRMDVSEDSYNKIRNASISYLQMSRKRLRILNTNSKHLGQAHNSNKTCRCLRRLSVMHHHVSNHIQMYPGLLKIDCDFLCVVYNDKLKNVKTSPDGSVFKQDNSNNAENDSMTLNNVENWSIKSSNVENGIMAFNNTENGNVSLNNAESKTMIVLTSSILAFLSVVIIILLAFKSRLYRLVLNMFRKDLQQEYSHVTVSYNKCDHNFRTGHIYAEPNVEDSYITPIFNTIDDLYTDPMLSSNEASLDIAPSDFDSCSDTENPDLSYFAFEPKLFGTHADPRACSYETFLGITQSDCEDSSDTENPVYSQRAEVEDLFGTYHIDAVESDLISHYNATGESDARKTLNKVKVTSLHRDGNENTGDPCKKTFGLTGNKWLDFTDDKTSERVNVTRMSTASHELIQEEHAKKRILTKKHSPKELLPEKHGQLERLPEMHGPCGNPIKVLLSVPVSTRSKQKSENSTSKSELTIQFAEQYFSYEPESIVAVKPLKAAEDAHKGTDQSKQIVKKHNLDEQQGSNQDDTLENEHVHKYLDWDRIIRYLVQRIPTKDWKLFFNCLFDYGKHMIPFGISIDHKISQIESDVGGKGGGVSTLMFELFKSWKEIMGTEVSTEHIDRALTELGYNSIASEFRQFLRCLPVQSRSIDVYKDIRMATAHPRENGFIANGQRYMDVFALHNTTETVNIGDSNRLQVSRRESDKVSVHIATKNVPYPITNFPSLPGPSGYDTFREQTGHGRKRYLVKENELSSDSNTESVPLKKQRLSNTRLGRKKREVLQAKRKISGNCVRGDLVQLNEDDKDSLIIDLIKRLLRIDQDLDCIQYNLFVDHVLTMTKTKANISESVLLSIMYFDYENVQQIKGRHSHVTYILDTKDIMLHFDGTEWELLNLYGEKARGNIENRLKTQNGKKFVSSKYLFIKYNGNAFIEEPEDSTLESDTESPLSTFKPAQYRTGMDSADSTDENTFLTKQHFHRIVKVASSNTDKEKVAETNEAKKCLSIMQLEKVRTATRNGNVKMRIDSTEIASRRKSI